MTTERLTKEEIIAPFVISDNDLDIQMGGIKFISYGRALEAMEAYARHKVEAVTKQRDELLMALKEAKRIIYQDLMYDGYSDLIETAIKNAER